MLKEAQKSVLSLYKILPGDLVLKDAGEDRSIELSLYFNDLYKMFMDKVTQFAICDVATSHDEERIKRILEELIKVKHLIIESTKF